MKIILATRNRKKIEEISEILKGPDTELLTLDDFPTLELPEEKGMTFKNNALRKARFIALKTNLAALADDSGLEVDILGMRPGVFSARYAGKDATDRDNIAKLLTELKGVPIERRGARFRCVIAYVEPGAGEVVFEGTLRGIIAEKPSGEGGFGYDPVFFLPDKNKTVAELSMEDKNAISHRAEALRKLKNWFEKKNLEY